MENLFYNISQVLGITIIHSLWQGLTIFMVLYIIMQFAPNLSANAKYKMAFGALTLMLGWFIYTLATEVGSYTWSAVTPYHNALPLTAVLPQFTQSAATSTDRYSVLIAGYMPYVTMLYIAGLVFNTLKLGLAWNNIYRIKQQTIPADFQQLASALAKKMGIARFVKVAFSQYIDVPCITGFVKPIILLPCTISTYLSADEVEAILLHELAHIRRNDYLLNLLQQAIGILLFFNPFSILINRIINRERENCCDDVVVQITGSPLIYAQALLKLEQNKQADWQLALAATGKKYHLLNRIERIMKTQRTTVNIRPALIALALLTCSLTCLAWLNPKIKDGKVTVKSIPNALNNMTFGADTVIKQKAKTAKFAQKSKLPAKKQAMKQQAMNDDYMSDAKMEALSAEMEKHAQKLEQYYNSPEFKKMQDDMEKKGAEMEAFYNSPKMKELQEQMEKKSAEFEKMNDSPEMKKLQEQLEASGKKIEAYYNSPEFAKIQKLYEKEAELFATAKPGTAEYKKHEAEFKALAGKFKDYSNNPAMKEQRELTKKLSEQMRSFYQSPEFKKTQDEMRAYGDSMRKYYQNPAMKEQNEAMRKMSAEMRSYEKNPDIIREREEMKKLGKQMREYRNSPEYRKKVEAEIQSANRDVKERVRAEIAEARAHAERAMGDTSRVRERRAAPARTIERATRTRTTDTTIRERRAVPARATERPTRARTADTSRVRERSAKPVKASGQPTAAVIEAKVVPAGAAAPVIETVKPIAKPKVKPSPAVEKPETTLN